MLDYKKADLSRMGNEDLKRLAQRIREDPTCRADPRTGSDYTEEAHKLLITIQIMRMRRVQGKIFVPDGQLAKLDELARKTAERWREYELKAVEVVRDLLKADANNEPRAKVNGFDNWMFCNERIIEVEGCCAVLEALLDLPDEDDTVLVNEWHEKRWPAFRDELIAGVCRSVYEELRGERRESGPAGVAADSGTANETGRANSGD